MGFFIGSKHKIYVFLILYFMMSILKSQERMKLEIAVKDIENKQEFVSLANHYLSIKDTMKYDALTYLLENTKSILHSDYLLNRDRNIYNRILLADSMYFNLVKNKTYDEIKGKAIQDSLKKIGLYIQSLPWSNPITEEELSFEDSPLKSLTSVQLKDHIDHCFFLRENSPIIKIFLKTTFTTMFYHIKQGMEDIFLHQAKTFITSCLNI